MTTRMKTLPLTGNGILLHNATGAENTESLRSKILAEGMQSLSYHFWRRPLSVGSSFAGHYSTSCYTLNSLHSFSWISTVLMSKVSPVLLCESCKTVTPYVGFDMALPCRREFGRSAGAFPKLPPLPHRKFFFFLAEDYSMHNMLLHGSQEGEPWKVRKASDGNSIKWIKM